jgi:hypothetical protein
MGSNKFRFLSENVINSTNKPHIYKIVNNINQKYYIGVHSGTSTDTYCGSGYILNNAYKIHGIENFTKYILEEFETIDEAYKAEEIYVDQVIVNDDMSYNACLGGYNGSFITLNKSEKHRKRMSEKNKGKNPYAKHTEEEKKEHCNKISQTLKNKTDKEKQEISRKISEASKNVRANKTTEELTEWMSKISKALKGKICSEETKEKISIANKGKINISLSERNKSNNPNSIKVKCPYDNHISSLPNIGRYIQRYHSDKKQWIDFTKEEKEECKKNALQGDE